MKIASSELFLKSERAAVVRREERETLRAWTGATRPNFEGSRAAANGQPTLPAAVMRISEAARALASAAPPPPPPAAPPAAPPASADAEAIEAAADEVEQDPVLLLLRTMIEMLTGQSMKVFSGKAFSREVEARSTEASGAAAASSVPRPAGWGVEYDYHALVEESETTTLSAQGSIRTADGRSIAFTLDLAMQRHHHEETNVSIRAGDAVRRDPLVINFGGTAAQLSDQRFSFDLDGDGRDAALPLFASASGYLAFDRNGNGRIDSGRELFGPATDDGFGELARLDGDGNGWIDENDAAFDALRVWTPAAAGTGTLAGLRNAGVAAIALGHVASPFELRSAANADLGAVRAGGVWLAEDGKAGSVQEIDLTI